jgi:hypothetical protein
MIGWSDLTYAAPNVVDDCRGGNDSITMSCSRSGMGKEWGRNSRRIMPSFSMNALESQTIVSSNRSRSRKSQMSQWPVGDQVDYREQETVYSYEMGWLIVGSR